MNFRSVIRKLMMFDPGYRKASFLEQKLDQKCDELRAAIEAAKPVDRTDELRAAIEAAKPVDRTDELRAAIEALLRRMDFTLRLNRFLVQYDAKFKECFTKHDHYISYTYPTCFWHGWGSNLGDWIQTIATESAIQQAVGHTVLFESVPRDELVSHHGGTCIMQGWYEHASLNFLPGPDTCAIWLGTHFQTETRDALDLLWQRHPTSIPREIGCRDLSTLKFCQSRGIHAYFSRCLTLTFPRRSALEAAACDKVFFVDCPDWIVAACPETLRKDAVIAKQKNYKPRMCDNMREAARDLLTTYRTQARLVVTTGLHCAQPCVAMGIPVVLIDPGYEEADRFSAVKGIIPVYSKADLFEGRVDFSPKSLNIERLKLDIIENLRLSIRAADDIIDYENLKKIRSRIESFHVG